MDHFLASEIMDNFTCFLAAVSIALLGVYFYDWTTPFRFKIDLTEKDNPALGVNLMGYVIGLMLLLGGAASTGSGDISHPLDIGIFGLLAILLLRIGATIADKLILPTFSVWKEIIEDRNVGTAFVTASVFIATGTILKGALTGDSSGIFMGILTTIEYFIFSQVLMIIAAFIYIKSIKYKHKDGKTLTVYQELQDRDNPAVGLSFGGFMIGVSIIVSAAIEGNDITSLDDLVRALSILTLSSGLGIGSLLLVRPFTDKAVFPYASMNSEVGEQQNLAIGGINAAFYVGFGLILSHLIG